MARDIVAIDVHIHLSDETTQKAKGSRTAQMAKYFGRERPPVSIDELADQYRARKMMAVLMNTRDEIRQAMDGLLQPSRMDRRIDRGMTRPGSRTSSPAGRFPSSTQATRECARSHGRSSRDSTAIPYSRARSTPT